MKSLTLRQPWAGLVVSGQKDVENRSWPTSYRGPLLIHAGLQNDILPGPFPPASSFHGAIIGLVDVIDCTKAITSDWAEAGAWHWLLTNPRLFQDPIPVRGKLGLWTFDPLELISLPPIISQPHPFQKAAGRIL